MLDLSQQLIVSVNAAKSCEGDGGEVDSTEALNKPETYVGLGVFAKGDIPSRIGATSEKELLLPMKATAAAVRYTFIRITRDMIGLAKEPEMP